MPTPGRSSFRMLAGLALVALSSAACVPGQDEVTVYFPVLDACEADASTRIEESAESSRVTARLVSFDDTFRSPPEVAGFVEVTSSDVSRDILIGYARGFAQECLPEFQRTFDKANPADATQLFDLLEDSRNP